ncbi:MAG: TetR family transcriptional regulator C-terminal domain-containing protein, partial [Acidaminococcaceae bacterium]|nr:TetR family transcriptional regulator C-terminal domain-containing protein [Acidaminococcaceae bacterium]
KKMMTEHIPEEILGMIKVYCYGTVQLMNEWLLHDMKLPPETLVEIWKKSLPEPLKIYLYE